MALEMIIQFAWDKDTPTAWIKKGIWQQFVKSKIDDGHEDLFKDALEGPVRIDKLLVLFQQISDPSSFYVANLDLAERCLKANTSIWIETLKPHGILWWEVAPINWFGRVKANVKCHSKEEYAIAEDGHKIEGLLGPWLVEGESGWTWVGSCVVKINIELLARRPDLLTFVSQSLPEGTSRDAK